MMMRVIALCAAFAVTLDDTHRVVGRDVRESDAVGESKGQRTSAAQITVDEVPIARDQLRELVSMERDEVTQRE